MACVDQTLNKVTGELLIVVAALIWGVAFYFQKTAMLHIGPLLFLGLRGAVAACVLIPFAVFEQRRSGQPLSGVLPVACVGGVVFFLAAFTQQAGIVTASVTNTGFLTALYVVVTPFLFWVYKKQRPSAITWLSAALAFVGVWALSGGSLGLLSSGDLLVAGSSLFWATLLITTGEASKWARPLTYTCVQFLIVAILGICGALLFESVSLAAIGRASSAVAYVGVLSSALTFAIMAIALKSVPAPRASILLSLETLFAAMAGYVLLNERLTPIGWCGAALILGAVLVLRLRSAASPVPADKEAID